MEYDALDARDWSRIGRIIVSEHAEDVAWFWSQVAQAAMAYVIEADQLNMWVQP